MLKTVIVYQKKLSGLSVLVQQQDITVELAGLAASENSEIKVAQTYSRNGSWKGPSSPLMRPTLKKLLSEFLRAATTILWPSGLIRLAYTFRLSR